MSIYDVASRIRIGDPIPIAEWNVRAASLRPDGMAVAIGDGDGIAIWDINPGHLQTTACRLAGRNITRAEWDTHLTELGAYRTTCPEHP